MRVFDFEGVVEAVEEVKEEFGGSIEEAISVEEKKSSEEGEADEQEKKPVPVPRKTVIPDSEDEDEEEEKKPVSVPRKTVIADSEDEDDEEDEMLLETPIITTDAVSPQKGQTEAERPRTSDRKEEVTNEGKVSLVLIDNLAYVLNPLLKEDYVKGKHTQRFHLS